LSETQIDHSTILFAGYAQNLGSYAHSFHSASHLGERDGPKNRRPRHMAAERYAAL
jgi:hypothetical protein